MIEGILSFMFALGLAQPAGSSSLSTPWVLALVVAVIVVLHRSHHWLADWVIQRRTLRARWRLPVPIIQLYVFWFLQNAGWSAVVERSVGDGPQPLAVALALLPWVVLHLSWLSARRRIEIAGRRKSWPLVSYLLFHVRIWIIPLTPVLLTGVVGLAVGSFPAFGTAIASYPSLSVVGSLLLIGTLFSCSPFLARMAVPTHSLPRGALRTSLEEVARNAGFRYLDIRVCETRNHVANAAFLGVLGRVRYVIITDGLLQRLSREQMAGVFAHEVGHSMRRHVVLNLCMIASFTVFAALITQGIDDQGLLGALPLLLGFPAFLILVYAPIARRFESEADLFAATTLGTPEPIVDSLTALGRLYPHRRQHGGLVHPGLDERISFIERATSIASERAAFEGRMSTLKRRICLVAALPLVWLAVQLPGELVAGDLRHAVLEASRTEDEEAALLCLERLQDWGESGGSDPGFELGMQSWQTLAIARQRRGDFEAAAEAVEAIAAHRHKLQSVVLRYNSAVIFAQQSAAVADWPALDREVSLARKLLQELVPLFGERDEQIFRERQDVLFLLEGRNRLRAWGVLHGDADRPTGDPKAADAAFLRALDRGQSQASEERLTPPWKQAFREHLENAQTL